MYYVDVCENVGNRQNRDGFDQCVSRRHFVTSTTSELELTTV